jgi:hypothetical protein
MTEPEDGYIVSAISWYEADRAHCDELVQLQKRAGITSASRSSTIRAALAMVNPKRLLEYVRGTTETTPELRGYDVAAAMLRFVDALKQHPEERITRGVLAEEIQRTLADAAAITTDVPRCGLPGVPNIVWEMWQRIDTPNTRWKGFYRYRDEHVIYIVRCSDGGAGAEHPDGQLPGPELLEALAWAWGLDPQKDAS